MSTTHRCLTAHEARTRIRELAGVARSDTIDARVIRKARAEAARWRGRDLTGDLEAALRLLGMDAGGDRG